MSSVERLSRRGFLRGFAAASAAAALPTAVRAQPTIYPGEIPPRSLKPEIDQAITAIEERLKTLPEGKTLFVPVGENHNMSSSSVFQKGLLAGLKERGHAIAYGAELPYNMVTYNLSSQRRHNRGFLRNLFNCDSNGQVTLVSRLASDGSGGAAMANRLLQKTILDLNISTRFNDLPGIARDEMMLDHRDPILRRFSASRRPVSALNALGLEIRNLALVAGARDHAKDAGARIYIQHGGMFHLFGGDVAPYRTSQVAMFKRRGEAVLPIMLGDLEGTVHPKAYEAIKVGEALSFDKIPDRMFDYTEAQTTSAYKKMMRQEVDYLRKMGEGDAAMPTRAVEKRFEQQFRRIALKSEACPESSSVARAVFGPRP